MRFALFTGSISCFFQLIKLPSSFFVYNELGKQVNFWTCCWLVFGLSFLLIFHFLLHLNSDILSADKAMFGDGVENELKRRLSQHYLTYLNMDDTPEKLVHKTKLERLILDHLSLVPHKKKFDCVEVADCFDKSVLTRGDRYNPSRAAIAFEALEKYANNLLTKPWRKEFRVLYPYGEYVRGFLNKELVSASNILYLMGYRIIKKNGVSVYALDQSVVDSDTLARISLDCLIAFVECQMMIQISDAVEKKGLSVSWLQILEIRANSVWSMDQVVNYIIDSGKIQNLIDLTARCSVHSNARK